MVNSNTALLALRDYMTSRPPKHMVHDDFLAGYDAGYYAGLNAGRDECMTEMLDILTAPISDINEESSEKTAIFPELNVTTPDVKIIPIFYRAPEVVVNG